MWRYSTQIPKFLKRYYCNTKVSSETNLSSSPSQPPNKQDQESQNTQKIIYSELKYNSKVPLEPISDILSESTEDIEIESKTIQLLERLSLVDVDSKEAYKILKDSIQFANKVVNIDTTGIEPLYTVLENQPLHLREDQITEGNCKDDILKNAKITEDEYFVAPPGNIPLEQEEKKF